MSSRPWREKPKSRASAPGPLVPTSAVNATTQRLVVTALFFLLQGVKVSAARTFPNFLVFSALDAAFANLLPLFAVPRLNFKPAVISLQVCSLVLLNYSLFISAVWLRTSLWLVASPFISALGLSRRAGMGQDGLISGKYVVDILPEASARLDTISPLCIHPDRQDPVFLRLTLENAWPSGINMGRADLGSDTNYERRTFSKREIAKMPAERKNSQLYIPVSKPGAYYLDAILDDHTGLRVKAHRDRIVVPPCPLLDLALQGDSVKCKADVLVGSVKVTGVGPFIVNVNGKDTRLGSVAELNGVSEAETQVSLPGGDRIEVTRLTDGVGNVLDVNDRVAAKVIEPAVATLPGSQHLARLGDKVKAQVHVSGDEADAPFTLHFRVPGNSELKLEVARPGLHQFEVAEVGKYVLDGLAGSRCGGRASGEFDVFVPPPVSISTQFAVVEDKCAGPTGMDANLHFEGTAPFRVGYRTLKGSRVISQKFAEFGGADGVIRFRPKDVGEYRYEIVSIEDKYRHLDVSGDEFVATQRITEMPGAQFKPLPTTRLCGTTQLPVGVIVRGRGPFTLKYSIDDEHEFSVKTGGDTATDTAELDLDLDLPAGKHFVKLISLTDRNGCVTPLPGTRTPDILVQPHLAHLRWAENSQTLKSADPVNLELDLAAESLAYPATVVYEHTPLQGGKPKQYKLVLTKPADSVPVTQPGTYRLVSLDDGICGGTVDGEAQVSISLYERPRIEIGPGALPAGVCSNAEPSQVVLRAFGEPPFTIVHEMVDSLGKSNTTTHQLKTSGLRLDLANDFVGTYTHYLWIMDVRYPDFNRPRSTIFKHEVWAPSEALFVNHRQRVHVCENKNVTQAIPVALKGQAPFLLTVQIGSTVRDLAVEHASRFDLRHELESVGAFSTFGNHGREAIKILEVVDAHGCRGIPAPHGKNEVDLQVLPEPVVPQPTKLDYCVGEKISFAVSAVDKKRDALLPPNNKFRMEYMLGSKRHRADISQSHVFEKYAHQPGNLSVLSVADSNGCRRELEEPQLMARVHALPKSTITEESHFSIYKGDHITLGFAFEGTPPFTFKYTRSVNGVVKERKQVKNVMDSVYNITVEDGGEYEIVELQDRFCQSKRRV